MQQAPSSQVPDRCNFGPLWLYLSLLRMSPWQSIHTWDLLGSATAALTRIRNGAPGTASSVVEPTHKFIAPACALRH